MTAILFWIFAIMEAFHKILGYERTREPFTLTRLHPPPGSCG